MKIMRDVEHGSSNSKSKSATDAKESVDNAKFTMIGLSSMCLPPTVKAENDKILNSWPMFVVPADTNEPMDVRYTSDIDTLLFNNKQRNPATAVKISTATSSPMQMKIELLAALAKGKPILCIVFSNNKKFTAFGRNVLMAIELLDPDQRDMVKVFVHGWSTYDGPFLMEAIKCARKGQTIDEALTACEDLAQRTFCKVGFTNAALLRKLKAWKPGVFSDHLDIPEGHQSVSGTPPGIRPNGVPLEKRMMMSLAPIGTGTSMEDSFELAARHIKSGLEPGQKIGNILLPCVGRPDFGHILIRKLEEEGVQIVGTPNVYTDGMIGAALGTWGSVALYYKIIEE